jgi:hypothetical protein
MLSRADMINASSFFTNCTVDANLAANTCNRNGDKVMLYSGGKREGWRAHEHLKLSGLYDNQNLSAPGVVANVASNIKAVIGVNVPKAPWPNTGYCLGDTNTTKPDILLYVGSEEPNWTCSERTFTHSEAYSLDKKLDDGIGTSGIVQPWSTATATCRGNYNLSITAIDCSISVNLQ